MNRRQGKLDDAIELQKRGAELDPLNVDIWVGLAWSYRGRRDLKQARAMLDRALALSPNDANIIAQKAETYAAGGDLETSWQMLRNLKFSPTDEGVDYLLDVIIMRRDYDEAVRRIEAMYQSGKESPLFKAIDRAALGRLQLLLKGDKHAVGPLLEEGERGLRQLRDQHEGGIIVLEQLMYLDACLGRRDEVEQLSTELHAIRRPDKWTYPRADWSLALAYAQTGDANRAVPLLEKVLHENYAAALTPPMLRFDPVYDAIRNDPRFEKLCQDK